MDDMLEGMMGQGEVPETGAIAAPAPIQMDQQTFMQILQMLVQSQQAPQGMPQPMPPQGMPPGPPQGMPQRPDPRIAQALMG